MGAVGKDMLLTMDQASSSASTDTGSVSRPVASLQARRHRDPRRARRCLAESTVRRRQRHGRGYAAATQAAEGMAMLSLRRLLYSQVAAGARLFFANKDEEWVAEKTRYAAPSPKQKSASYQQLGSKD
ncbi:uncharacterized protein MAM_04456 [Metarhizium album ARSEF 1941]|uniref:Uncharacterized protein n=1 Tax=Metarhizium album (strain ARSEF 1941) TaxID=1081103 RepID=A0A0B2WMZ5_METAS|nr:uncharacterized protein MAM_04456 [Metarhizium album ARSEF 1941]KHN97441.1 hypothetical protein MAM_04456 [Metarhizium album ARSEF 1941]